MIINSGEPVVMHYGVKGMKWGVRKRSESNADGSPTSSSNSGQTGPKKMGVGGKLAIGAVAAVGVGAAAYGIKKHGGISIGALRDREPSAQSMAAAQRLLDNMGMGGKTTVDRGRKATEAAAARARKIRLDDLAKSRAEFKNLADQTQKMIDQANNDLYKNMVDSASKVGIPTISRTEFNNIKN